MTKPLIFEVPKYDDDFICFKLINIRLDHYLSILLITKTYQPPNHTFSLNIIGNKNIGTQNGNKAHYLLILLYQMKINNFSISQISVQSVKRSIQSKYGGSTQPQEGHEL